mmetsp:Transcript_27431/g.49434  ORF Transcript_27431/g.49434 Transcript_27431/m.49434 type:complete len:336 (-) Transcript_27431:25-1032(-)
MLSTSKFRPGCKVSLLLAYKPGFGDFIKQIIMWQVFSIAFLATGTYSSPTLRSPLLKDNDLVVPHDLLEDIKSKATWEASDSFVKGMTVSEARKMLGTFLEPSAFYELPLPVGNETDIPTSFDAREQWPECIHPIRDQGKCGSCWAFGLVGALGDRYCIAKGGFLEFAPQWLISCAYNNHGCAGGLTANAWGDVLKQGIATEDCLNYTSGNTFEMPACPSKCADGSRVQLYNITSVVRYNNPKSIQMGILTEGPIEAQFLVFQDFMSYKGGIYKHVSGGFIGGHAIRIVGWGNEDGTDYWIVANSWSTSWGEKGYFRIAWDQCGISSQGIAGIVR